MRKVIYVVSFGQRWKMRCEHCGDEPVYDTQAAAISAAKTHVAGLPPGTLAQILVQRDDGTWREEWTYGKDPFPPKDGADVPGAVDVRDAGDVRDAAVDPFRYEASFYPPGQVSLGTAGLLDQ